MAKRQTKKSEPPSDAAIIGEIFRLSQEIVSIRAAADAKVTEHEREIATLRETLSQDARATAAKLILGPVVRAPRQARTAGEEPYKGVELVKLPPKRNGASVDGKTLSAVAKALSDNPSTATQIAGAAGVDVKTASAALKALREEGKAASTGQARGTRWTRA